MLKELVEFANWLESWLTQLVVPSIMALDHGSIKRDGFVEAESALVPVCSSGQKNNNNKKECSQKSIIPKENLTQYK